MTTVTISLPETLKTFIDEQLATKGYGNVSEYFRSLLREAQEREEEAPRTSVDACPQDELERQRRGVAVGRMEDHRPGRRGGLPVPGCQNLCLQPIPH